MEKVAIIGLDDFSIMLIKLLEGKVKYISVLDFDSSKLDSIDNSVNICIAGNIEKSEILDSFFNKTESVDTAFICTGENMTASILAAYHLTENGVNKIYAKVINEDHAKILKEIGVNEIVFPEEDMAKVLISKLSKSHEI